MSEPSRPPHEAPAPQVFPQTRPPADAWGRSADSSSGSWGRPDAWAASSPRVAGPPAGRPEAPSDHPAPQDPQVRPSAETYPAHATPADPWHHTAPQAQPYPVAGAQHAAPGYGTAPAAQGTASGQPSYPSRAAYADRPSGRGASGYPGPSAPQGQVGFAGPSAPQGQVGFAGPSAPLGQVGFAGPSAPQGQVGYAGQFTPAGYAGQPAHPSHPGQYGHPAQAGTAAPQPGTAPQPVVACRLCGSVPARKTTFRGHQGMVIVMRFLSMEGPFCRDCGLGTFRHMTSRTLVQGWYGYGSLIITPITVLMNLVRRRHVAALEAPRPNPYGPSRQPMDPGPRLLERPMTWCGLVIAAGLVSLFVLVALRG